MRALVLLLLAAGCLSPATAQERLVHLQGTVRDAGSGQLLPSRLYVQGPDGAHHLVRSASANGTAVAYEKQRGESSEVHTTLSAHAFTADLPPGRYTLIAERGKEYLPASREVNLDSKPVEVDLRLKRFIDMAGRNWYSGDTHVHRTLQDLPNIVLAEDLNVTFPLVYWVTRAFEPPAQGDKNSAGVVPESAIAVDDLHHIWPRNTEYEIFTVDGERHTLGAFFILGHRGVFTDGAPPVASIAEQAHEAGAVLELDKHAWPWSMALVPLMKIDLYELANNHMWRAPFGFPGWGEPAAEYMNIDRDARGWTERGWIEYSFANYYALLNCGFRLRPTAGTASGVHPVPLGHGRVYVHLEGELTPQTWLEQLNRGRSFVTTGPLLFVTVNGKSPGETFRIDEPGNFTIAIEARSVEPIGRIELVRNGDIVESWEPANLPAPDGGHRTELKTAVDVTSSTWLAIRVYETTTDGRFRFAHSSPVFIDVAGQPLRPRRREAEFLVHRVQSQIERSRGVIPPAALAEYERALQVYQKIAATARP